MQYPSLLKNWRFLYSFFLCIIYFFVFSCFAPTLHSRIHPPSLFIVFYQIHSFLCDTKKKRAFKHVKRSAFQICLDTKIAAFPPLCAFSVTRNALILYFIYLFYFNIRKPLSFRDSPGISHLIPAYPVQYPFVTCILLLHTRLRSHRRRRASVPTKYNVAHWLR